MVDARSRERWNRQAELMAWMGNCAGGKRGGKAFTPAEFGPYRAAAKEGLPLMAKSLPAMRPLFGGRVRKVKRGQIRVRRKKEKKR